MEITGGTVSGGPGALDLMHSIAKKSRVFFSFFGQKEGIIEDVQILEKKKMYSNRI